MWIIPVDLASVSDFTAVAAVQVSAAPPRRYKVRHLDRWQEPYPKTVEKVAGLANHPELAGAVLAVDATGVGKPVLDLLRAALPGRLVYGVTITGGSSVTAGPTPHDVRVPKKDLIGAAQVLLTTGRLHVAPELPLTDVLVKELANFRVKITPALNEQFESWRDGIHDDLVLALAMAAWVGENLPTGIADVRALVPEVAPGWTEADGQLARAAALEEDFPGLFGEE